MWRTDNLPQLSSFHLYTRGTSPNHARERDNEAATSPSCESDTPPDTPPTPYPIPISRTVLLLALLSPVELDSFPAVAQPHSEDPIASHFLNGRFEVPSLSPCSAPPVPHARNTHTTHISRTATLRRRRHPQLSPVRHRTPQGRADTPVAQRSDCLP